MRNPTVGTIGQMFAVKAAVRGLAEATRWRIRTLQVRRDTGALSQLDRELLCAFAASALVTSVELTVVTRWIVTGRGPGPGAIIIFV
jgi:hypothetical protein